jgi:hypothetical protein
MSMSFLTREGVPEAQASQAEQELRIAVLGMA